jgi:predicted PhzF superfamily epimerase YddE/YHI9
MRLPLYQVDAFTDTVFGGNPAAIVPLETWLPDDRMQAIAAENNLAETAFFVPEGDGFGLRWFTPTTEVDLCGHATLATAHVIMTQLQPDCRRVVFSTVTAGDLTVTRDGDLYTLEFPARPAGPAPRAVLGARDLLVVYDDAAVVRALSPDMVALAKLDYFAVMVTAPGSDTDFVSRFFAPRQGIPEDPVTGSAHCTLVPYWAERLGRSELTAYQASARGGRLWCRMAGDRVMMSGKAVLYLEGTIVV